MFVHVFFRIANLIMFFIQLKGIKGLGNGHALRVATQILESGYCPEVEEKRNDKKFLSLQVFCLS